MSKSAKENSATPVTSQRLSAVLAKLRFFVPAVLSFSSIAFITQPLALMPLLLGNVLLLAALCQVMEFSLETHFLRIALRRGVACFVLLVGYAGLVALLLAYPLLKLIRDGSLVSTIELSTALVLALLSLWRIWPAFGLLFVWDDAYSNTNQRSWIFSAITRSLKFGAHLTSNGELFFTHGLPVSLSLLLLTLGAFGLAGICGLLPSEFRITALLIYGVLLAPLAHWVIINRSVRVLLAANRWSAAPTTFATPAVEIPVVFPAIAPAELDATVLRATRDGMVELALAALERGANPNTTPAPHERDQRSLIILAALMADLRLLRALIAKGAEINRAHAGLTPLLAATRDSHQGRPEAVMTLLTNGADPRSSDIDQNTPLHYAALNAEPTVAALLLDAESPMHAINREGLTPLGTACAAANWTLVRFLLERGAKLDVEQAQPALVAAAGIVEDDPSGVKLLLKRKARPDAVGPLGRTALMAAAMQGHAVIARVLLDAGASVDLADSHGTTALMEAARFGAHEVIEALAKQQPVANLLDASGRSALLIACQSRQSDERVVKQLLALGADPQLAMPDGRCSLDFAVAAGRWNLAVLLDPACPLPAYMLEANTLSPVADADSSAHLLDALRFEHWSIVNKFTFLIRGWSQSECLDLYRALSAPAHTEARAWLIRHGLDVHTIEATELFRELLEQLPHTLDAVSLLLQTGVSVAGIGNIEPVIKAAQATNSDQRLHFESLAQELIDRGADFCSLNNTGRNLLYLALEAGLTDLAPQLLQRGCDPNSRGMDGCTPLHAALRLPSAAALSIVPALIRAGANPEAAASNNETPYGLALARPEAELKNWLGWPRWKLPQRALLASDLPSAATVGDSAAIDKLLALGFAIDATDAQGASALLRAAGAGHAPLVKKLLQAGASPAITAYTGANALSAAVSARWVAVLDVLLEHGIELEQRLPGGSTALMVAAALGYPEMVERLLEHGAKVDAEDEKGNCALQVAAQFAFQSTHTDRAKRSIEQLIRYGAARNRCNNVGQSALLLLLGAHVKPGTMVDQRHVLAVLTVLIEQDIDLNIQDQRGVSALHACAMHGLLLPARQLLATGANPLLRDGLDRSAGDVAHLLGYVDVAAELGKVTSIPGPAQTLRQRLDV